MYKVGDRVRVTKLLGMDSFENIRVGDVHTVTIIRSENCVGIRIGSNNEYPLIHIQIEKVEEEVKVKKFKVGDKVKVLVQGSFGSEAEKGRIYTIETVDYDDNSIELEELPAFDQWVHMDDVELVSESSYKVGDKVKVLTEDPCGSGAEKGKVYTVKEVDRSSVRLKEVAHIGGWVTSHHVELVSEPSYKMGDKVKLISGGGSYPLSDFSNNKEYTILELNHFDEKGKLIQLKNIEGVRGASVGYARVDQLEPVNQTEFTFPEMAQKLIDGEFEVGTELVADGKSYFVDKVWCGGYGLSTSKSSYEVSVKLGASHMNSTWTVKEELPKEEPTKEMTIEELQKELGYKIKITE